MVNHPEDVNAGTKLPGFGLPLDVELDIDSRFPSVLYDRDITKGYTGLSLTTLREFTMLRIMNELTDKVDWNIKIFNEDIASKWKVEAMSGDDVTESMADWVNDELKYKAKIFEQTGIITVYNGDVVKSDIAISASIKETLKTLVKPLEEIPTRLKDWHPGSDGKVLDLVHPTLGTTHRPAYSRKFQWLPCDVDISGGEAKITSYINNLYPQIHAPLYTVIEKIITRAIPLWNVSLTPIEPSIRSVIEFKRKPSLFGYFSPIGPKKRFSQPYIQIERIPYSSVEEEEIPKNEYPPREVNEDEDHYEFRLSEWLYDNQRVTLPEPGKFTPPNPNAKIFDLKQAFEKTGLQIIVKLANIELTPEKPEYEGGTWHIEGQLNEHICASALYYYSSSNVTPSHLAFRQQSDSLDRSDMKIEYEQYHFTWLREVFGCEQDGPAVQNVGSVETREGRLITFPNILQHQVQPFKLADPTKPGHRKILALFLVDPYIRVISTANVPCQQRDWWRDAIIADGTKGIGAKIAGLPVELQNEIFDQVDEFPIDLEEAKVFREELMEERTKFAIIQGKEFELNTFSLCEH